MTYIPLNFFYVPIDNSTTTNEGWEIKSSLIFSLSQPNMMLGNLFGVYFTYILIGCDPKIGKNIFIF